MHVPEIHAEQMPDAVMSVAATNVAVLLDVSVIHIRDAYVEIQHLLFVPIIIVDEMQLAESLIKMNQNVTVRQHIQMEIHIMNVCLKSFLIPVRMQIHWNFVPYFDRLGTPLREFSDCRTHGCSSGECIRQGSQFVCKKGMFDSIVYLVFLYKFVIRMHSQNEMLFWINLIKIMKSSSSPCDEKAIFCCLFC